jgi:hypothetical protein
MSVIPAKELELWLLGWSESHNGGCKVTFQVTEDDLVYFRSATIRKGKHAGQRYAGFLVQLTDQETPDMESLPPPVADASPTVIEKLEKLDALLAQDFRQPLPAVRGRVQSAASGLVANINAVSAAGVEPIVRPPTKAHLPNGFCGLAVRWCSDLHFQEWCAFTYPEEWGLPPEGTKPDEIAKFVICKVCHCPSRKALDQLPSSGELFRHNILQPYGNCRRVDGVDENKQPA